MNIGIFRPHRAAAGGIFGAGLIPQQSGPGTLTSSALRFNNGEDHVYAPFVMHVMALDHSGTVMVATGLTSSYSALPEPHYELSITDDRLERGQWYAVWYDRTDLPVFDRHGIEILQAQ